MNEIYSLNYKNYLFYALALLSLFPFISPALSLILGILFITIFPIKNLHSAKYTKKILQYSIIGLGFGMNVNTAIKAGSDGILFTISSILSVFTIGLLLGKTFQIDKKITQLITTGTAICGGSAIAVVSPIIEAKNNQNSIALGVVFLLNALALVIFPSIGNYFNLSQIQFGIWAAIAIHDTSSVVGAATKYGNEALQIALQLNWLAPYGLFLLLLFFLWYIKKEPKLKFPFLSYYLLLPFYLLPTFLI